ncbi:MAG: hypothetical protein ACKVT2_16350 [Saprospiraceae bacterium]
MEKEPLKNKIGGGSFKFMSSPLPPEPIPKVMPSDKRKAEFALTMLFGQLLLANGHEITKIAINENDADKGADTIIRIDGVDKGIQITKLILNDLLKRKDVGLKRSYKISELITENFDIDFKLNIFIYPPNHNKNVIPKNRAKLDSELASMIRNSIQENIGALKHSTDAIFISVEKETIKEIASTISLNPIPNGHYPIFPGQKNVYVNYEIDNNFFTHEEVVTAVNTIFDRKNNGKSEFLLIWADRSEILSQDEQIFELIESKFSNCSFEEVFFLTFYDRADLFRKTIRIKNVKKYGD